MRFKELIERPLEYKDLGNEIEAPKIDRISDLGGRPEDEVPGNTDKDDIRTVHYEIEKSVEMYLTNTIVGSAVDQYMKFLIPNRELKFASKDPETIAFLDKYHKKRDFLAEFRNYAQTRKMLGNGYLEKQYTTLEDGRKVLDLMFSINDARRIFVNPNSEKGVEAFLFEVPVGTKPFIYLSKLRTPGFYTITYIKNYAFTFKQVYGFPIDRQDMFHGKSGWSTDNLYGRGCLANCIDWNNVLMEIVNTWDTVAKTRQMDIQLYSVSDDDTRKRVSQTQLNDLAQKIRDSGESFHILNIPLKLMEQSISVSGKYDLMEGVFDIMRRAIIMGMLPQHLTPWNDSGTTQGAREAMPAFLAALKQEQNELMNEYTKIVIDDLRDTYPWLAEDATLVLDEPKVIDDTYYIEKVNSLVDMGIINVDEAKATLLKLGIIDKDLMESQEGNKDNSKKTDDKQSNGGDESKENSSKSLKNFSEVAGKKLKDVKFNSFKILLKDRKGIDANNYKQIEYKNLSGRQLRLLEDEENYYIFDGLEVKNTISKDSVFGVKSVRVLFSNYISKVRKDFEIMEDGKDDVDEAVEDLEKTLGDEIAKRIDKFFKQINKTKTKKEDFVSPKIFPKLDDIFKGLDAIITRNTNSIFSKLGLNIIKSGEVGKLNTKNSKSLQDKRNLMKKNISQQLKDTKNDVLRGIKSDLTNGIAAGQSVGDIQSGIRKKYNYDKSIRYKIKRTVGTELRRSANLLKLKKWLDLGFTSYVWNSREDSKVRPKHAARNKKVFQIKDSLSNKDIYPGEEINCRCFPTPYL